jgi:hypothetical protein
MMDNLGGGEYLLILAVIIILILVPFFLGYFMGLSKGRKENLISK